MLLTSNGDAWNDPFERLRLEVESERHIRSANTVDELLVLTERVLGDIDVALGQVAVMDEIIKPEHN